MPATVLFDAPAQKVHEVDKRTGREILVRDESLDMPGLQVSLDDREGRFSVLPAVKAN